MKATAEVTRDRELMWREVMTRWEQTGLSQQEFCEKEKIKLTTFGYWRRELKRRDSQKESAKPIGALSSEIKDSPPARNIESPLFVPIQLSSAQTAPLYEIVLPDGLVIRLPSVYDLEPVVHLVRTLEAR